MIAWVLAAFALGVAAGYVTCWSTVLHRQLGARVGDRERSQAVAVLCSVPPSFWAVVSGVRVADVTTNYHRARALKLERQAKFEGTPLTELVKIARYDFAEVEPIETAAERLR